MNTRMRERTPPWSRDRVAIVERGRSDLRPRAAPRATQAQPRRVRSRAPLGRPRARVGRELGLEPQAEPSEKCMGDRAGADRPPEARFRLWPKGLRRLRRPRKRSLPLSRGAARSAPRKPSPSLERVRGGYGDIDFVPKRRRRALVAALEPSQSRGQLRRAASSCAAAGRPATGAGSWLGSGHARGWLAAQA